MVSLDENELLTRVGRGTPMGELIRRYWVPACLSEEVPEPDCDPVRVRLLGEDLVAFRDTDGRPGVMHERCPHRGASLFFARNEEGGLRCLYHGWKIAVDGQVLDTPCEPAESMLKHLVRANAYPTRERGDVVWAYLGPPNQQPPFPDYWWMSLPTTQRSVGKIDYACNYLQGIEGTTDSAHTPILHSGFNLLHWSEQQIHEAQRRTGVSTDLHPGYDMDDTPYGFRYAATRVDPSDPTGHKEVRVTPVVLPFTICLYEVPHLFVPADDEHTWLFDVRTRSGRLLDREQELARRGEKVGVDLTPDHHKLRNFGNNYLQNRPAMRERREDWSYSGIPWGKPHQDTLVTESMGPIYDRQGEHLGVHDVVVLRLRQVLLAALERFMQNDQVPAQDPSIRWDRIVGEVRSIPIDAPWNSIEVYADHIPLVAPIA